jgi:hypothetical protein
MSSKYDSLAIRLQNMHAFGTPSIAEVSEVIRAWHEEQQADLVDPCPKEYYAAVALEYWKKHEPMDLRVGWSWSRHKHLMHKFYYDLRVVEPGGPKTWHGIGRVCRCGKTEYWV